MKEKGNAKECENENEIVVTLDVVRLDASHYEWRKRMGVTDSNLLNLYQACLFIIIASSIYVSS